MVKPTADPNLRVKTFDYGSKEEKKKETKSDKPSFLDDSSDDELSPDSDDDAPSFKKPTKRKKVSSGGDGKSQFHFIKLGGPENDPNNTYFTPEEIMPHNKIGDCWTVYKGKVYDITSYISSHPGGKKVMLGAGKDCTKLFNDYHHWVNCEFLIGKLHIGMLKF